MEVKTETTRTEDIIISILCIFIGITTISLDVHFQISCDIFYLPSILSYFGFGILFLSYVFGKNYKQNK